MKNSIFKIVIAFMVMLSFTACNAQIKNAKIISVKIYGNCDMCKSTIEKAANIRRVVALDWNKDTKMAKVSFDSTITNQDEILKRVALAGYDSEFFLAPDEAYNRLADCCHYDRNILSQHKNDNNVVLKSDTINAIANGIKSDPLEMIFIKYFALKDALILAERVVASSEAKQMAQLISQVKMEDLTAAEHTVWMQVLKDLSYNANYISNAKDISIQRNMFINLSKNIYELIKVSKQSTPTYIQHCPMANDGNGADWLSKDLEIKNPYFGTQMLSCGKTIETIK